MDSSDGLAVSLYDLSRSSGNGFYITNLPLTPEATLFANEHHLDPASVALYGGEEYELVFTVNPDKLEDAKAALQRGGCSLQVLGRVTKEKRILYIENGKDKLVGSGGWEHFTGLK
jgi:thiamine-monophosphate kinase